MSDMSDTPGEEHSDAIAPDRIVNARDLSRNTGALLWEVALEGRSLAIRHFGRVTAFVVPANGRVPTHRDGKLVYEVGL